MTNQRRNAAFGGRAPGRIIALALMAGTLALGAGCEKKKKPAPPPPPPPKPKVVIPDPVDVNAVAQQLHADARVNFPSANAPADRSLAVGVVKLADALAKGDADRMKSLLEPGSQTILDDLVSSGGWAEGTKPIGQVRIVAVSNTDQAHADSSLIGTAIQGDDGAYLLAWHGRRNGDSWVFAAAACQGDKKSRASDFDGVSIVGAGDAPPAAEASAKAPKASTSRSGEKPAPTPPPAAPNPDGPIKPPRRSDQHSAA